MARDIATAGGYAHSGNARPRYNRTGATLVSGSVGFVDHGTADAASTTIALGQSNVIAVSTAGITACRQLVVHAGESTADDKIGNFFDSDDGAIVLVRVDSTTDIAKEDWLKPVNAGDHLVKATNANDYVYAQALEARTSNDEGTIRARLFSNGRRLA